MGQELLAIERERRCRDMTMRELHNSGAGTLFELEELDTEANEKLMNLHCHSTCLPGRFVKTVIFEIA
ncbi:hypothetical protein V8C37DRAFT_390472 [Trichoderma ceciliae]